MTYNIARAYSLQSVNTSSHTKMSYTGKLSFSLVKIWLDLVGLDLGRKANKLLPGQPLEKRRQRRFGKESFMYIFGRLDSRNGQTKVFPFVPGLTKYSPQKRKISNDYQLVLL